MPLLTRPKFDFSKPATLLQSVEGVANQFDGTRQIGRAYASVGSGDGEIVVAAPEIGDWANGAIFEVNDPVAGGRVSLAGRAPSVSGPVQLVQLWPAVGDSTSQSVHRFNDFNFDPRAQLNRDQQLAQQTAQTEGRRVWRIAANRGAGNGGDPPPVGTDTFAGGGGAQNGNTFESNSETANGGLFAFDADETLVLRQVVLSLDSSVAWTVGLALLGPGYDAHVVATIASGTGQVALVTDKAVYLAPNLAIVVTTATPVTGAALVTVQRA